MSALESPPTITSQVWQDPWCNVTGVATDDFYGQNKGQMNQVPAFYHHHHQPLVQGYHASHHHPAMMDASQNNNNNSDANSSSTTSSTTSTKAASKPAHQRQVNFKLDIKAEPHDQVSEILPHGGQPGMQKVPSISDLSDPESSSLDIPCSQVGFVAPDIFLDILKTSTIPAGSAIDTQL